MDRLEKIKADPLYLECLSLNSLREKGRVFCRHDLQHMILVSRISYKIIKETGGIENFVKAEGLSGPDQAREVIFAAGLLHDMGRWRQYDTGEDHALAGSRMARAVLERAGFTPDEIRIVARAIGEHRRAGPGTSYLGRVISRADDLSRPCGTCEARAECYKYDYMESLKEKKRKLGVRG